MKIKFIFRRVILFFFILSISFSGTSQKYLTGLDSSLFIRDTVRPLVKRLENLYFSGYIQSQFQAISEKGAKTFGGGDFSEHSSTRFMLRRARLKADYLAITKDKLPKALFTFQIDATERSVRVRDMFLRIYETKRNDFSLTSGIFARPFGYEVNLSSSYRETPERGRMSQILLPSERDIGVMLTYESLSPHTKNKYISANIGIFNGPGLSSTTDFDNVKDIIGRISLKPARIGQFEISGGLSLLHGGWKQLSKYVYEIGQENGITVFRVDSAESNIGKTAPRHYYGGDVQLSWTHDWGTSELRMEFWTGKQTGAAETTANPGSLPASPAYIRNFNGAFIYFLQDIISPHNQLVLKYDWYDPNRKVKGNDVGKSGTNFSPADIRYATLGAGFIRRLTATVKLVLYYEFVTNEATQLAGYTSDLSDDLFTCRLQFRF